MPSGPRHFLSLTVNAKRSVPEWECVGDALPNLLRASRHSATLPHNPHFSSYSAGC